MVEEVAVNGERVIVGARVALVASKSEPGYWHVVKNDACTCKGYLYRGRCRHLAAVAVARDDAGRAAYLEEMERQEYADLVFALRHAS